MKEWINNALRRHNDSTTSVDVRNFAYCEIIYLFIVDLSL